MSRTAIHTLALAAVIVLSACATSSNEFEMIRAGQRKCLMQESSTPAGVYKTTWCTSRQLFQPNKHRIVVNDQVVFDGTDYEDIRFERDLTSAKLLATCTPRIDITEMKTDRAVAVSTLPKALIEACKIVADEHGLLRPFLRDEQCSKVFAAEVGPLVGKVFPFKRTQECSISVSGSAVFKGTFYYHYERRGG